MKDVVALDCTLRDGGYCNQWRFREENIKKIINALVAAKVELIECGFLSGNITYDAEVTKFSDVKQLDAFIPQRGLNTHFVLMMNYGEYDVNRLPDKSETSINGIRVAFHKKDRYDALKICETIKKKGYEVFIQPMVSMLYSDQEFSEMIRLVNNLESYAFYIVDSFGMMNKRVLAHYFDLTENNLKESIFIGFHSHNNLQSAFANAQSLIEKDSLRKMIIDSSVYGMGRGAGNLNSELFLNELNVELGKTYEIRPLLQIMDEVLNRFYEENPWGYSLPNYLSAIHMIHPNYAQYLSEKKTLKIEDIDEIFSMLDPQKGVEYDEHYISDLYFQYMSAGVIRNGHLYEIKQKTRNRKILLIAPGRSAQDEQEVIKKFVEDNDPIIISINHDYPHIISDYIFISNKRRFSQLDQAVYCRTISTSNIKSKETYASIDYYKLLNAMDDVRDNAGLMAIKFAIEDLDVREIYLAGLDGYSHDLYANFWSRDMTLLASEEFLDRMNYGMKKMLDEFGKIVDISFITTTILH